MRTTLLLTGTLLLSTLLACGGSEEIADGGDAAVAFCDRIDELEAELGVEGDEVPDESQLASVVAALRELDPPAPIAGDFDELLDAYDVLTRIEAGDEQAAADLEAQFETFAGASERVDEWTRANCGDATTDAEQEN